MAFDAGTTFAAASAAIHLSGYAVYGAQASAGRSRPNPATWTLWVFLSALNCTSYLVMSADPAKAAVAFAGAFACTVTFAYSLKKGRVSRPSGGDFAALAFGIAAAAAWYAFRNATYANLILQAGFLASMVPTARGIVADPTAERPLPWLIWGLAYAVNLFVVVLRWHGHPADVAYPLLNLCTHTGIGLLAMSPFRRPASALSAG